MNLRAIVSSWQIPAGDKLEERCSQFREGAQVNTCAIQGIEKLKDHPKSGKTVQELGFSVYKEIVNPPCRIFYREEKDIVFIIHVIREEQNLHLDILKSR